MRSCRIACSLVCFAFRAARVARSSVAVGANHDAELEELQNRWQVLCIPGRPGGPHISLPRTTSRSPALSPPPPSLSLVRTWRELPRVVRCCRGWSAAKTAHRPPRSFAGEAVPRGRGWGRSPPLTAFRPCTLLCSAEAHRHTRRHASAGRAWDISARRCSLSALSLLLSRIRTHPARASGRARPPGLRRRQRLEHVGRERRPDRLHVVRQRPPRHLQTTPPHPPKPAASPPHGSRRRLRARVP